MGEIRSTDQQSEVSSQSRAGLPKSQRKSIHWHSLEDCLEQSRRCGEIENCERPGVLIYFVKLIHPSNLNDTMLRLTLVIWVSLVFSMPAWLSAQEIVKAPKGYVKYKLSNVRKARSRFGDRIIAFDYVKTQDGIGGAQLVVRSDNGRMGVLGIQTIENSGTIRLERGLASLSDIMGRGDDGLEFFFVSGSLGSSMYSPYSSRNQKEILVSNVLQYGKLSSTVNVRELTKKEKDEIEKERIARLPPPEVPTGYVRSNLQTKILPGAKVQVGYRGKWRPGTVVSVSSSNRVKVLPENREYCQTVSLDKWLAISNETMARIKRSPESFSAPKSVLKEGNVKLQAGMEPLSKSLSGNSMNLLEGTPLFKDSFSRWDEVYFLSSDNVKVRVLNKKFGRSKIEFVPVGKLAIQTRSLKDQSNESAKEAFAANVKDFEKGVNGLTGARSGAASFPTSRTRRNRAGTLDSSAQPGLSSFPMGNGKESGKAKASTLTSKATSETIRTWSDASGKYRVEAKLIKETDDLVYLERKDGKSLKIPISKLSDADQNFLKDRKKKADADNPFMVVDSGSPKKAASTSTAAVSSSGRPVALDFSHPLKEVSRVTELGWGPASVAISPDKKFLVIGRKGSEVSICDVKTGQILRSSGRMDHMGNITAAGFAPDGKSLILGGDRGVIEIYSIGNKGKLKLENQFSPHSKEVRTISFSADGKHVLTGGGDKEARFWELRSGRQIATIKGFGGAIKATCIRPSDNLLLATDGGTLKVYDLGKEKIVEEVKVNRSVHSGQSAAISPNGLVLATANGYEIRLWNLQDYNEMPKIKGDSIPWSMTFSPDSRHLISGHSATLHLWDAKTTERKMSHSVGRSHYIKALGTSADGTLIACGAGFKEVAVVKVQEQR